MKNNNFTEDILFKIDINGYTAMDYSNYYNYKDINNYFKKYIKKSDKKKIIQLKLKQTKKKNILLLGIASSGKSTIFKSIQFKSEEKQNNIIYKVYKDVIIQNCVSGILKILKKAKEYKYFNTIDMKNNKKIMNAIKLIKNFDKNNNYNNINSDLGNAISIIWNLESIQIMYKLRGLKYSFPDNMDYFLNKICDIMH